jgi:hypothetical protein
LALREFSEQGWEVAAQAVWEAFDRLPVGTPRAQLIQARDAALAPWHAALAEHRAEVHAAAETDQRKRLAVLESQLRPRQAGVHRAPVVNGRAPASR